MALLVDTNVVSELRKKSRCNPAVAAWQLEISGQELFISVISLMEIKQGVLAAKRKDARLAELLNEWYEAQVKPAFDGCVLSIDFPIAERCAILLSQRTRSLADGLIAATAYVNDLTLVTRNTADFADTGIRLINPWNSPKQ